jgi:hypothetical protein
MLRLQVLISELEHGGYESAARCLGEDAEASKADEMPSTLATRTIVRARCTRSSLACSQEMTRRPAAWRALARRA